MIIAVDFDGTIVEHKYPAIGETLPHAFEVLKELQDNGHKLILWTYRDGQHLKDAVDFCRDNGIRFYAVNHSKPNEDFDKYMSRKIYADVYIDDRNIGGFPGWLKVKEELITRYRSTTDEVEASDLLTHPEVDFKENKFTGRQKVNVAVGGGIILSSIKSLISFLPF